MSIIYTETNNLHNSNVNTNKPNQISILGEKIRLYREGCGITQAQLAKTVGAAQGTISRIESGHRKDISAFHLFKIAQAIGARMEDFFLIDGGKNE